MRLPGKSQDPLRTPLNRYLGTEGQVRILRVLAATQIAMGRNAVAQRAELHPTGVRRILNNLAEEGLIEIIGSGRNQAVTLRDEHPMVSVLRELFREERKTYESLMAAIRGAIASIPTPIDALWIENPPDRTSGFVNLGVLCDPDEVDSTSRELEERLSSLGENLAVCFAVHAYTAADSELTLQDHADGLADVTLVHGWIPLRWRAEGGGPIRSHRDLDERALRLASAIADRLPNEPAIIERAINWIDRRISEGSPREAPALMEWRRILKNLSIAQIRKVLVEDSEKARELRQSLPFAEVLSPRERMRLLRRTDNT